MVTEARPIDEHPIPRWTFLTNHAHVLLCIARDPEITIRRIADLVGISERAANSLVTDLEDSGYLTRTRVGRRNKYTVHTNVPFRHPLEHGRHVDTLLSMLTEDAHPGA